MYQLLFTPSSWNGRIMQGRKTQNLDRRPRTNMRNLDVFRTYAWTAVFEGHPIAVATAGGLDGLMMDLVSLFPLRGLPADVASNQPCTNYPSLRIAQNRPNTNNHAGM